MLRLSSRLKSIIDTISLKKNTLRNTDGNAKPDAGAVFF